EAGAHGGPRWNTRSRAHPGATKAGYGRADDVAGLFQHLRRRDWITYGSAAYVSASHSQPFDPDLILLNMVTRRRARNRCGTTTTRILGEGGPTADKRSGAVRRGVDKSGGG